MIFKCEDCKKKKNVVLKVLAVIGAIAAVAGIAYAIYRFFTPDYLEDFEDDFDDDFEDISYTMHYTIDADADREFVIEVLSIGVCRAWLEEKILDITNIKQLFSDKNSKWYSQAAHLNELQALYSSLDAEQKRLISDRNSMSNRYIEEYRL